MTSKITEHSFLFVSTINTIQSHLKDIIKFILGLFTTIMSFLYSTHAKLLFIYIRNHFPNVSGKRFCIQ